MIQYDNYNHDLLRLICVIFNITFDFFKFRLKIER